MHRKRLELNSEQQKNQEKRCIKATITQGKLRQPSHKANLGTDK